MALEEHRRYIPFAVIAPVVLVSLLLDFGSNGYGYGGNVSTDPRQAFAADSAGQRNDAASLTTPEGTDTTRLARHAAVAAAQPRPSEASDPVAHSNREELMRLVAQAANQGLPPIPPPIERPELPKEEPPVPPAAATAEVQSPLPVVIHTPAAEQNQHTPQQPPAHIDAGPSQLAVATPEGTGDASGTTGDSPPANAASSEPSKETVLDGLPVDVAALSRGLEFTLEDGQDRIRNKIALEQLWDAFRSNEKGIAVDLSHINMLLDGTKVVDGESEINGKAYFGPYPFEAFETKFAYKRFRGKADIKNGKGVLGLGYLMQPKVNSEGWDDRGTICVRLILELVQDGKDMSLGTYDTFLAFKKEGRGYKRLPWIVEGPLLCMVTSDDPTSVVITFKTDSDASAEVIMDDGRILKSSGTDHQVKVHGLSPGESYHYRVRIGEMETLPQTFQTAPPKGTAPVRFAYTGDSREGVGGGMHNYMGVNYEIMHRHAGKAAEQNADFFLMGGDLINGYTISKPDFEGQFFAWKQAMTGFWNNRSVYPAMGNHEALLRGYKFPTGGTAIVDRWPYDKDSAEAVFGDWFVNPTNGPQPSDPRRPPYEENVYSFQFGCVKVIAFNNNYWISDQPRRYGGSPEGYIMEDQLEWIEQQIAAAESDETVKYVVLFAQEPVFPCGGHIQDAMWFYGNNNVRAYTFKHGKVIPEKLGMLDARNRFARAVGGSSKVAAVLCSDEHAYYRVKIDRSVPVGEPEQDDKNRDGVLSWMGGEPVSPLDVPYGTWYITSGGGGAPYYSEQTTPWTRYWNERRDTAKGFKYSSQENVLIFEADEHGISMKAYNPYGEVLDKIDNLMEAK